MGSNPARPAIYTYLCSSVVEHRVDNAVAGGSFPPTGTKKINGAVAQLGERLLCKQNVAGSIPVSSTKTLLSRSFQL